MGRKLLLLLALFVVGSATVWATTGLISNGGFETNTISPWTVGTDYCPIFSGTPCNPWHAVSTQAHSGSFSVEDQGATELDQSVTPTAAILITDASFWFKQDPTMGFAVQLTYSDGTIDPFFFSPIDGGWHQYDLMGDLELGKTLTRIGFASYSGLSADSNGPSWLDDVTINAKVTLNPPPPPTVPEPASILLLGSGLAGLAGLKKRR